MPRPHRRRQLARPWNSDDAQEQQRPPGLRGKDIGMYYRNLSIKNKNLEGSDKSHLRIPEKAVQSIYKCLEKIEEIAVVKNIYVPPAKKLVFVTPSLNSDFIPISARKSETITHEISNIRNRGDDDIIFVKSIDPEITEIVDVHSKDIMDLTSDPDDDDTPQRSTGPGYIKNETNAKTGQVDTEDSDVQIKKNTFETMDLESETKPDFNEMKKRIKDRGNRSPSPSSMFFIDTKPSVREEKPSTSHCKKEIKTEQNEDVEMTGYLVSNIYRSSVSNASTSKNPVNDQSNKYKYSYDDIITGTFQEKLDECLARGIEITKTDPEVEKLNTVLRQDHESKMKTNEKFKQMLQFRRTLPTYRKGQELLEDIEDNQVVVISGETGCGKSTQVPQLILDKALETGKGGHVKILVTEPRRIAASSLAVRVAEERGESLGVSVGYCVRLEVVSCRDRGSIKYCTTGVLLVELEQDQSLGEYSHIVLDEVHERDCQIDIAMCMLRQILQKRKDLKLILMSATIDAESLSEYYNNCPMFHIEGLAYPVEDVYLEDILQMTNFKLPPMPNSARQAPVWHKYVHKHRDMAAIKIEKEVQYRASIDPWMRSLKKYSPGVIDTLADHRIEDLNLDLILVLLKHICTQPPGAILVFLPGISEISKLLKLMWDSHAFPERSHDVYSLHSKLPSIDQKRIFVRPPDGVRKIIVATNIAETSITIDDVVYVIDCGKMKYKGLDVEKNLATLQNEWVSKANMRQRRGRAGRCQPGICYHLVTSYRAENLPDRLLPELQRSNLLEEVLCLKKLRLGKAEEALKMMPAIPADKTIKRAIKHLQQVGALDERETLTPLGWHLARLPVPPAAGKLLVLGALLGCLDRAASLAAVWGFKDPFNLVIGKQAEADAKKRELAMCEPSDHVAMAEAVIQWERSQDKRQFAFEYFLSNKTLELLSSMKKQFAHNLKEMGFLSRPDTRSPWENRNEDNLSLFKAIVAAALYPNVASVAWLKKTKRCPLRIKVRTPEDGKVSLHPSSVMYTSFQRGPNKEPTCTRPGANWLVYGLKQKSSELFLLDVTCVYTLPLLFFGDLNLTRSDKPDECQISILSHKVFCKKETAELLCRLRALLDQVLTYRIGLADKDSKKRIDFDQEVLSGVIDLITAEDEGIQYMDENYDEHYN